MPTTAKLTWDSEPPMNYVIDPPATPSLAVAGIGAGGAAVAGEGARFPVRRVYCAGRNCAAHAREK